MKKVCIVCVVLLCMALFAACGNTAPFEPASSDSGSIPPSDEASVSVLPDGEDDASVTDGTDEDADVTEDTEEDAQATDTAEPSESASPSETATAAEIPDKAGDDMVMFDIYKSHAEADLNKDGTMEQIEFEAGDSYSTLTINGTGYAVKKASLAQVFAITDVDASDNTLGVAVTDKYDSGLADSEKAFTWLYWWNGSKLINMGGLMDVKFDGAWRTGFDPKKYFNGKGQVTCLARTQEFSDVWYNGHYKPSGSSRMLKEITYAAKPVNEQESLKLKHLCVLLKHADSKYFGSAYSVMWDYASGYATLGRDYSDEAVSFIPQQGEKLKIVSVLGQNWFKLKASDGKTGWLKCVDMKIQGYYQVMHYKANDIFEGIVVAG